MFIPGKVYRRRDIHAKYKGQQQGGISTPANYPIIMIFTGDTGKEFGYRDGWTEDGIFLYTGEGQRGDMQFTKGNKAIRDHIKDGKDIHLFKYIKTGYVQYIGQMVCVGYHIRKAPDIDNNLRDAIVFELSPIEEFELNKDSINVGSKDTFKNYSLEQLRNIAKGQSVETANRVERKNYVYIRSQAVKEYALKRAGGICENCNNPAPFQKTDGTPFLEVHHIKRLSDGGPDDPAWVAAVCPNCHRELHYGINKKELNKNLLEMIKRKELNL